MNRTPNWAEPGANAERAELVWDREPVLFRTASKSPSPSFWIPSRVARRCLASDGDLGRRCGGSAPRSSERLTRTRSESLRACCFEFADRRERRRFSDARRLRRRAATAAEAVVAGARRTVWCACAAARRTSRCRKKEPLRRVGNTPSRTRSRPSRNAESESLKTDPPRSRCAYLTSEAIELLGRLSI